MAVITDPDDLGNRNPPEREADELRWTAEDWKRFREFQRQDWLNDPLVRQGPDSVDG